MANENSGAPATPTAAPGTTPPPATPTAAPGAAPATPSTALTAETTTPGTSDGKQGGKTEVSTTTPVDIKINVPDGVKIDKGMIDSFVQFAKDNKISQEAAQKYADSYFTSQKTAMEVAQREANDQQLETITKWAEEAKVDKEIGGTKWDESLTSAKKALQKFGNDDLKKVLDVSGLGNHKSVIRFFANVGKLISEDNVPSDSGKPGGEVDLARILYPTMFKEQ